MYDATRYTYDASPLCAYKFTGKERDTESGLDNLARQPQLCVDLL
jgi:hypothetical protein